MEDERRLPGDPVEPGSLPEYYTIQEASRAVGMSAQTLRKVCRIYLAISNNRPLSAFDIKHPDKPLPCYIPRGADANHTGPSMGYRIKRTDLQKWYLG